MVTLGGPIKRTVAFVTDSDSYPIDHDMPALLDECERQGVGYEVCSWKDATVDWQRFSLVIPRSPWTYMESLDSFLDWCHAVEAVTILANPASVAEWGLRKSYLTDLDRLGIPTIPTHIVRTMDASAQSALDCFLRQHSSADWFVVKPLVGAYSSGVERIRAECRSQLESYVDTLTSGTRGGALVQPYLNSVDEVGEKNLVFLGGRYSHAIGKSPMLLQDGTVRKPTIDMRQSTTATPAEQTLGARVMDSAVQHLGLPDVLLYGRIDIVQDNAGCPVILEMDICEPSLNLNFDDNAAERFVAAIRIRAAKYAAIARTPLRE